MTLLSGLFMIALGVRIVMVGPEEAKHEIWWFFAPILVVLLIAAVQGHRAAKRRYKEEGLGT